MSHRAEALHTIADTQIGVLVDLISVADDAALQRPCPGREKLGDGTIGAIAAHTAANYERIGAFVATGQHDQPHTTAGAGAQSILERLTGARQSLGALATLTDVQLDAIPPKDSFRFCDGERTLEQVVAGLLKHQGHQLQALRTALAGRA
jgi:hypothetical protein